MDDREVAQSFLFLATVLRKQYDANMNFKVAIEATIQALTESFPDFEQRLNVVTGNIEADAQDRLQNDQTVDTLERIIQEMSNRLKG